MKRLFAALLLLVLAVPAAHAQMADSTGQHVGANVEYGDTVYSSTWNRISGKPDTATRWPSWHEVAGKPSTFPTHWSQIEGIPPIIGAGTSSLDSRYAKKSDLLNGKSCSSGQYVKGVKSNGNLECASLPSGGGGGGGCSGGASMVCDPFGNCRCEQRGP